MTAQQHACNSDRNSIPGNCPFFAVVHSSCRAALLTFMPDSRHLYTYCCSDDYDDCALFLAKALRSSSPGGHARDLTILCEK